MYSLAQGGAVLTLLPQTTIDEEGTTTGTAALNLGGVGYVAMVARFAYGSDGTSAKVYLQTSLDGGSNWVDIACAAFTTSAGVKAFALTTGIAPASQGFTPGDAALSDNTVINGVIGDRLRVKLVTAGTYAGTTHMTVTAFVKAA